MSQQTEFINQKTKTQGDSWTLKKTIWIQNMNNTDSFKDIKYYKLFINNVSNYSSSEEQIVMICEEEQMRYSKLLFATAQGMIKRVDGSEFQVSKRTIAATKLQEEDRLVAVKVVTEYQNVVLQTKNGYFLRFLSVDVPEKKKAAVGVRGIKLQKKDELEEVYLFEEGTETKITYGEKTVSLNRLKLAKRDGTGTKSR